MEDPIPVIEIFDHTESSVVRLDWLTEKATLAVPKCLASTGSEPPVLPELRGVEISLVDDKTISQVHADFLDDPTPTDVITFHHGEILISTDTAQREGPANGNSTEEELLLYLIHGLLHLNGHTDLVEPDCETMHAIQNEIHRLLLASDSA